MKITAREVGRQLVITLGGADDDMDEADRAIAEASVERIVVPPVDAEGGARIWAHYAGILFQTTDESAETEAVHMTKIALGAYADEQSTDAERARADAQWAKIEALRWSEAETVCQLALYWNSQGGGQDVVDAYLQDGHPKAQEALLTKNQLWNVYSRLRMLPTSTSGESESETPRPAAGTTTSTPSGSSEPGERDAFGIRRNVSALSAT